MTMQKIKLWWKDRLIYFLYFVIGVLVFCLFIVGLEICGSEKIVWFLGTNNEKDNKQETIRFIAFGIGGVLAVIGAITIHRRATAQEKNNDDIRFQHMITGLGDNKITVRVATFYRFYYLASKDVQTENFKQDVFEILCSYLRTMSSKVFNPEQRIMVESDKQEMEYQTLMERQTLFDILFKGKFRGNQDKVQDLVSLEFLADLRGAHFAGLDLSETDLSNVDFTSTDLRRTQLRNAKWQDVHSLEKADFRGAKIGERPITKEDLPADKGEYYADWNPPSKKEES